MAVIPEHGFRKSDFLSDEDNEKVRTILGPNKKCLALTVAQISFSNGTDLANRERIICFVKDYNSKSYFFYIYSNPIFNLIWKESLRVDLGYVDRRDFHIFKCESQDIKVKFRNTPEGIEFVREVRNKFCLMDVNGSKKLDLERKALELKEKEKKKLKKSKSKQKPVVGFTFGDPTNFTHVKHISTIYLDRDDIAEIFEKAGIDKDKLNARLTRQLLKAALDAEKTAHLDSSVKIPEFQISEEVKKPTKRRAPPIPPRPKMNETRPNNACTEAKNLTFDPREEETLNSNKREEDFYACERNNFNPRERANYISRERDNFNSRERDNFISCERDNFNSRDRDNFNSRERDNFNSRERANINSHERDNFNSRERANINSYERDNFNSRERDNFNSHERDNFNSRDRDNFNSRERDNFNSRERDNLSSCVMEDFHSRERDNFNSREGGDFYRYERQEAGLKSLKPNKQNHQISNAPAPPSMEGFEHYIIEQRNKFRPVRETKSRPAEVEKRLDNLADHIRKVMANIRSKIEVEEYSSDDNDWD